METALEVYNDVDKRSPETQPIKRRKKQSKVWEHFTIQFTQPGCRRAFCIGCNQSFAYSNGSKVAGTSHLKRHIDKGTCPALGKLFSVTFNHPASKPAAENIRPLLCIKNPGILNGQMVIGNCVARTFSGLAKDVLDKGKDVIKKVRDCVKHVKTSESHEERFVALMEQLQLPGEKVLSLDDQTQWDTTYKMLVAASELKEVFSCLDTADPDFKQPTPSTEDWSHVETLCTLLKPLLEAASTLQTTGSPSAVTEWLRESDASSGADVQMSSAIVKAET
ncbi:hypothetical protein F2Q69_00046557 [Brassica cretica]|uniref:BED-type domain-containing protein n=1 Tax=Brassica cretica TaxID=69181 RepID=A0A8S9PPW1_BRACR|nr:hypothetical protein F2Q69_00046557 [Brassica cretica]